jgi:hypothetical protein
LLWGLTQSFVFSLEVRFNRCFRVRYLSRRAFQESLANGSEISKTLLAWRLEADGRVLLLLGLIEPRG